MVRLAVVGSRERGDIPFIRGVLDRFHDRHGVTLLVSGGARGADAIGERWAGARGIERLVHRAEWDRLGKSAGHVRNEYIVRDADVVIAFVTDWRTSKGTRNTVSVHVKAQRKPCFMHDATTGAWTMNDAARAWLAGTDPPPAPVPSLGTVPCTRCGGTGRFITQVLDGQPVGPADSPCFRCGGKGHQTDADRRRNYGYDNFAPLRDR